MILILAKKRPPIRGDVANKIMFDSDITCCVCRTSGKDVQINHLDDNPSNNDPDNLAAMCLQCHNLAHKRGGVARHLNPELIKLYCDDWYERVRTRREEQTLISISSSGPSENTKTQANNATLGASSLTITEDVSESLRIVKAGETLMINPKVSLKLDSLENDGTIIVMGSLMSKSQSARLTNRGVVQVIQGGSITYEYPEEPGTFVNLEGGITIVDIGASFALNMVNSGNLKHHGNSNMNSVNIINNEKAELQNHGSMNLTASTFTNKGTIINAIGTSRFYMQTGGLKSCNDGGQIINFGQFTVGKSMSLDNINGGMIINNPNGMFGVGFIESGAVLTNDANSRIANSGIFVAGYLGYIINQGIFNNNYAGPKTGILRTLPHGGDVTGSEGTYTNNGTFNNNVDATIDNQGYFYREAGDVFNNSGKLIGNPIVSR